jgi:hypothetical protein
MHWFDDAPFFAAADFPGSWKEGSASPARLMGPDALTGEHGWMRTGRRSIVSFPNPRTKACACRLHHIGNAELTHIRLCVSRLQQNGTPIFYLCSFVEQASRTDNLA